MVRNNFVTVEKEVTNPFNAQGNYKSPGTSTSSLENFKIGRVEVPHLPNLNKICIQ